MMAPRTVIDPQHLTRLAEDPADPIEQKRLAIGEVVEKEFYGPLARRVGAHEIGPVEREVPQRLVARSARIATAVGFGSVDGLRRAFIRVLGQSPAKFGLQR